MAYLNQQQVIGNLGRDPEMKITNNGPVCNFSVATTKKWKDKGGELKEMTTWHNITAFGKTAELASQYLKKGSMAYISGETRVDSWEDEGTGVKKYKTYVVADRIQFLSGRMSEESDDVAAPAVAKAKTKKPHNHAPGAVNDEDELGF